MITRVARPETASCQLGRVLDRPMVVSNTDEGDPHANRFGTCCSAERGYAFDCWTPEEGLSRGYTYGRIEDAHYARNVEIRSRSKGSSGQTIACGTVDDFVRLTLDV